MSCGVFYLNALTFEYLHVHVPIYPAFTYLPNVQTTELSRRRRDHRLICVLCSPLFFTHLRFKPFRFIELRFDQPQNSSHIHWLSSCIINWGYIHVIRPKYRFSTVLVICMTSFRRIECSGLLPPWRFLHEVKSCRVKVDYCIVVLRYCTVSVGLHASMSPG